MSGCSLGSGTTGFVGLGAFRPTALTPFQFVAFAEPLKEMTFQEVALSTAVIGTGLVFAHYTGLFDNFHVSQEFAGPALVQTPNVTIADAQEDVGVHWMDSPAGYFPSKVSSHYDNGKDCVLQPIFGPGYCVAEKPSVKWLKYPRGYFPLNIPSYGDNGNFSILTSAFQIEAAICTLSEAPVPVQWLELHSEYIPSNLNFLHDDEVPFGYTVNLACPIDSEKTEHAFDLLRLRPTRLQIKPTAIRFSGATVTARSSARIVVIALITVLSFVLGVVLFVSKNQVVDELKLIDSKVKEIVANDCQDSIEDAQATFDDFGDSVKEPDNLVEDTQDFIDDTNDVEIDQYSDDEDYGVVEEWSLPDDLYDDLETIAEETEPEDEAFEPEPEPEPEPDVLVEVFDFPLAEGEELAVPEEVGMNAHIRAIAEQYWLEERSSTDHEDNCDHPKGSTGRRRRRRRKNKETDNTSASISRLDDDEPWIHVKRPRRRKRSAKGSASTSTDV